jgi:membrane protein
MRPAKPPDPGRRPICALAKHVAARNLNGMEGASFTGLLRRLGDLIHIPLDAFYHFNDEDGWALASHIALSALMALFPFLIVIAALAGFFDARNLAEEAARILLEAWPPEVAGPIAVEIHGVLTVARTDVLTLGVLFALYFASSGVESLRIGLNRSYGVVERRNWILLRLESVGFVVVGAISLLVFSLLIVLAPLVWSPILRYVPQLAPFEALLGFARFGVAGGVLILALVMVHLWLPAGHRSLLDIAPGVVVTLVLWLVSGALFGRYLSEYALRYATMYAGLATAVISLFFLYIMAMIFLYGGDLNAAVMRARQTDSERDAAKITEGDAV